MKKQIIGIMGRRQAGKDTFANLIKQYNASTYIDSFARGVKEHAMRIFDLTTYDVYDPNGKEKQFKNPIAMDIYLPQMHELVPGIQPRGLLAHSPREILQYFGTDYIRSVDDLYWVRDTISNVVSSKEDIVVLPDVRFMNEVVALLGVDAKLVRINRIDAPPDPCEHPSETQLLNYKADLELGVVTNDLSLPNKAAMLIAANCFDIAADVYHFPDIKERDTCTAFIKHYYGYKK